MSREQRSSPRSSELDIEGPSFICQLGWAVQEVKNNNSLRGVLHDGKWISGFAIGLVVDSGTFIVNGFNDAAHGFADVIADLRTDTIPHNNNGYDVSIGDPGGHVEIIETPPESNSGPPRVLP